MLKTIAAVHSYRSKKSSGAVFTGALLLLAGFVLSAAPAAVTRLLPATLILAKYSRSD